MNNPPANYQFLQDALLDIKAQEIMWIDISKQSSLGDYFVLITATSIRHAQAIADAVRQTARTYQMTMISTEDREAKDGWIVIDLTDIIVHIFLAEVRAYYNLEQLWNSCHDMRS